MMVNFFDRIYSSVTNRFILLSKLRYYSGLRFIIRLAANVILPIYFLLTQNKKKYCLTICSKTEGRIIVSLTSFPSRINRLWLVIETLLRQTHLPDKIILWLSEEQFSSFESLPRKLLRLQNRGLEIRFCQGDLRSHKKYYYALQEFPLDILITVDDDVFYNLKLVEHLVELYKEFPYCVSCNRCSEVGVFNKQIQPYILWKDYYLAKCPNYKIFPIGIGGVLYPPHILHLSVLNSEIFMKHCDSTDDIWLNIMARLTKAKAVKSDYNSYYLPIMNYKNFTLSSLNINDGLNDQQLVSVRNYCIENLGVDPFQLII